MQAKIFSRRSVLSVIASGAAVCATGEPGRTDAGQAVRVPWSSGVEPPRRKAPVYATDCHHHIYDGRFPTDSKAVLRPAPATVADYRLLQKRLGTTRSVVVQPSTYGVDNRCLIDALHQLGLSSARGVAVVDNHVSDAQLNELNAAGVRGIRFNLLQAGATTLDMLEPLSKRITPLGWHVQVNASSEQIAAASSLWDRLPCPVVFDHFGHTLLLGREDPAFRVIVKRLHTGQGWLKLSGAYIDSKVGPPDYPESTAVAKAYLAEAPEQLLWGTDWPHPTAQDKPDDAVLFDLFDRWVHDTATQHRILVDNPAKLYGFR